MNVGGRSERGVNADGVQCGWEQRYCPALGLRQKLRRSRVLGCGRILANGTREQSDGVAVLMLAAVLRLWAKPKLLHLRQEQCILFCASRIHCAVMLEGSNTGHSIA